MGIFDIFKRKKEEPEFGNEEELAFPSQETEEPNIPPLDETRDEYGPKPRFQETPFASPQTPARQTSLNDSDIQLMLTKLDLINQRLEVLDRRIQVIEEIAKESR